MYYGMPEKDIDKLKKLNCDVLGIFGNKDKWITPAVVTDFQKNMQSAKKNLSVKEYNADHGFANPSAPSHDKVAMADAYKRALVFYKARMK